MRRAVTSVRAVVWREVRSSTLIVTVLVAAVIEAVLGLDAERQPLESVAAPLSLAD